MTKAEVIRIVREHLEGLFPMACHNCNHILPRSDSIYWSPNVYVRWCLRMQSLAIGTPSSQWERRLLLTVLVGPSWHLARKAYHFPTTVDAELDQERDGTARVSSHTCYNSFIMIENNCMSNSHLSQPLLHAITADNVIMLSTIKEA
jgi:hypothetical protein